MALDSAGTIEREIRIEASREIVFAFLTEPDRLVQWMGSTARLDARAGGEYWLDYNGSDIMGGAFIEVDPYERVAISWGWEMEGAATPPGSSIVEFTLLSDGDATILRMVHSGLDGDEVTSHAEGWDYFLPRLLSVAENVP